MADIGMRDVDIGVEEDQQEKAIEEAIETYGFDRDEPGATVMWFGKFEHDNRRFDSLDEKYKWAILKLYVEKPWREDVGGYAFISPCK